jgi:hypothetical protein
MYIGFIMNFSCNMLCWVDPFKKIDGHLKPTGLISDAKL